MAKQVYKIPASLNENYLNMEIALQNKQGVGLKPLPVRVILVWMMGLLITFFTVSNQASPIATAGLPMCICWVIVSIALIYCLAKTDKAHQMQIEWIPALLQYVQTSNRTILTRRTANAGPFYSLVGIESIDKKSGLVKYTDGTFAYWYAVVGTASILLFPEDRDAILDRVNEFYKKVGSDCEIIYLTTKEAQKVAKQTAHLMAQYKALEFRDPDIDTLVREQYNTLCKFVGKEFRSIHQYMVLKGDNREALTVLNNVVIGEYEASSLMLKQCVPMYEADIVEVLAGVYSNGQGGD